MGLRVEVGIQNTVISPAPHGKGAYITHNPAVGIPAHDIAQLVVQGYGSVVSGPVNVCLLQVYTGMVGEHFIVAYAYARVVEHKAHAGARAFRGVVAYGGAGTGRHVYTLQAQVVGIIKHAVYDGIGSAHPVVYNLHLWATLGADAVAGCAAPGIKTGR